MELLSWLGADEIQTLILETFIIDSIVYPLDELIILKAIEIRRMYRTKLPDAIITAAVLINELILISRNTKDFKNISGLKVINPYDLQ